MMRKQVMDYEIRPKFMSCVTWSKSPKTFLGLMLFTSTIYYFVDQMSEPLSA